MRELSDLQRLMTRVFYLNANARELRAIGASLALVPGIKLALDSGGSPVLRELGQGIPELPELVDLLERALCPGELPVSLREGGLIADGYSPEIDSIRHLVSTSKQTMAGIEARERELTGIKNLKISYNKVFGYYLEVTKVVSTTLCPNATSESRRWRAPNATSPRSSSSSKSSF